MNNHRIATRISAMGKKVKNGNFIESNMAYTILIINKQTNQTTNQPTNRQTDQQSIDFFFLRRFSTSACIFYSSGLNLHARHEKKKSTYPAMTLLFPNKRYCHEKRCC